MTAPTYRISGSPAAQQRLMCDACPAGRNGRYDCPDIISADSKGYNLSSCKIAKWVAGEATDDTSGK